MLGYKINNANVTILCCANFAELIDENKDHLYRLLNHVEQHIANILNMRSKTKYMTTSKTPIGLKLVVNDKIIQQEMKIQSNT